MLNWFVQHPPQEVFIGERAALKLLSARKQQNGQKPLSPGVSMIFWGIFGLWKWSWDIVISPFVEKSRTMHPSNQSNLLLVLNTIKVRRKEKQSSCPLNIKLIKWANILPCLILFVYCIQHAIHTHSMLPLVLPIYMITYIIYIYDYLYRSCLYIW